jgi:hypothetical protein
MTRVLVAACAVGVLVGLAPAEVHAAAPVSVSVDRTHVQTSLGREFTFSTSIANDGSSATPPLVAHLNVLSLYPGVYVDPEDWSSDRTRYLRPIPAGGSRQMTWKVKAVNSGEIAVFVSVLPQSGAVEPPTAGPAIHVSIASRRTLNSGGIVPLAVGVPALLGLLAIGLRVRRRRR